MSRLHDYFEPLEKRKRTINRIFSIVLFVCCCVGIVWGLSLQEHDRVEARILAGSFLVAPVAVILFVASIWPQRGLAALRDPSRIVWYYGRQKGGSINAVMIGFDDGRLSRFNLPLISLKQGFSQEAFEHLRACAPTATSGYSEERRKAFRAHPGSLRRRAAS